jgi:hypothetical protein
VSTQQATVVSAELACLQAASLQHLPRGEGVGTCCISVLGSVFSNAEYTRISVQQRRVY